MGSQRTKMGELRLDSFDLGRWEDDIKMYLQEVGWGGMDWIGLA
jgi:hypothetical protein